jgi:AcrR family transcriptional regulator
MPRGFSAQERAAIRRNLLAQGRARLATLGMSKISVEELAHAAHISKGAFYQFFPSKEALFITLMEEAEASANEQMRQLAAQPGATARQRVLHFLRQTLLLSRHEPLLGHFTRSDLEALLRGASPEMLDQNLRRDTAFFGELIELWRSTGVTVTCSPGALAGLVQLLFILSLYADEFAEHYGAAVDFMLEAIADKLVALPNSNAPDAGVAQTTPA